MAGRCAGLIGRRVIYYSGRRQLALRDSFVAEEARATVFAKDLPSNLVQESAEEPNYGGISSQNTNIKNGILASRPGLSKAGGRCSREARI
ncbi:Hypothetical protein NTJ_03622 [Nesidiocoris tenuis]|uniref:Uncharacterized protein n=1 Tax=Nesidiocoris tenuis TaxID=355587 RepID=A0ABN7AHG3_9HEMI|nr:Hypothetical protein NTJ_03622 [Nesidiocoris tenuis]